jgi:hypothetical protein
MSSPLKRREFLQIAATGTILGLEASGNPLPAASLGRPKLISPGCRRSKVKVARLYMGSAEGLWPKPNLDLQA